MRVEVWRRDSSGLVMLVWPGREHGNGMAHLLMDIDDADLRYARRFLCRSQVVDVGSSASMMVRWDDVAPFLREAGDAD